MPNEPMSPEPEPGPGAVSADLTILFRGRRVRWLEHALGVLILPAMRWHARRGLRRTR